MEEQWETMLIVWVSPKEEDLPHRDRGKERGQGKDEECQLKSKTKHRSMGGQAEGAKQSQRLSAETKD